MEVLDLSSLDTSGDIQFELQLSHPGTGVPLDFFVEILGADSDTYQAAFRQIQRRMAERMKRAGRNATPSPEELEANALELLVTCTRKWRGKVDFDGKPIAELPCTPDNVRKVYQKLRWAKEQIDAGVHDRSNFLTRSAKT